MSSYEKLAILIEREDVTLLLPQHVIDETRRSRAGKIKPALGDLRQHTFAPKYPAYCRDYEHYPKMRKVVENLEKERVALLEQIERDIEAEELGADLLLDRLFKAGKKIEVTEAIVAEARLRLELGHPPGKRGSIGDAVNWESLLTGSYKLDLYVISADRDWGSPLDETKFNEFLRDEWKAGKGKKKEVRLYRSLTPFLKAYFPKIDLRVEEEKQARIDELRYSRSFATTHRLIAELFEYELAFSPSQVDELYAALLDNHQVGWILGDADVRKFYEELYGFGMNCWQGRADEVKELLEPAKTEETKAEDDIPF